MQKIIIIILALMIMVISCTKSPMEKNLKLLTGKNGYKYWIENINSKDDIYRYYLYYFDNKGKCITFNITKDTINEGIDNALWEIKKIRSVCSYDNYYYEYKFVNDSTILENNYGWCMMYQILKITEDTFRYILFRQDPNDSIHRLKEEYLVYVPDSLLPKKMRKYQQDDELESWLLQGRYYYKKTYKKDW